MRKGLFAVMLVAASFAGGAVVNGPGLRWAQAMILNRADDDGDGPAPGEVLLPPPDASSESIPSAPVSPVVLEPARPASSREKPRGKDGGTAPGKGEVPAPPTPAAAEVAPPAPAPAPEPKAPPAPEPKTPAPHEPKGQGPGRPAPSGRDVESRAAKPPKDLPPTLDELPPLELPADPPAPKDLDRARRGEPWTASTNAAGDAPDPAPSAAVSPRPFRPADPAPRPPKAAPASTAPANAGPSARTNSTSLGDWAQVRRTMVALGVARYGIEGEPGGRARFYCVIPLAGRHAVGQHFEAEGDDELQAAQVALRRVALWLAAEAPKP